MGCGNSSKSSGSKSKAVVIESLEAPMLALDLQPNGQLEPTKNEKKLTQLFEIKY